MEFGEVASNEDDSDFEHVAENGACATIFACTVRDRQGSLVFDSGTSGDVNFVMMDSWSVSIAVGNGNDGDERNDGNVCESDGDSSESDTGTLSMQVAGLVVVM